VLYGVRKALLAGRCSISNAVLPAMPHENPNLKHVDHISQKIVSVSKFLFSARSLHHG
jgi:hypothetical protein